MAETVTISTINLGSIEAIPPGQGRCYIIGSEEVAVLRQRNGRLFAIQNRCPHGRGPLSEGLIGNNKVICPLHAHQFNLETGTGSERTECIQVHSVKEINGNTYLSLEAVPLEV